MVSVVLGDGPMLPLLAAACGCVRHVITVQARANPLSHTRTKLCKDASGCPVKMGIRVCHGGSGSAADVTMLMLASSLRCET